jgi:hypothetical protein
MNIIKIRHMGSALSTTRPPGPRVSGEYQCLDLEPGRETLLERLPFFRGSFDGGKISCNLDLKKDLKALRGGLDGGGWSMREESTHS